MTRLLFAAFAAAVLLALPAAAEKKPRWVGNTPEAGNNTYQFVEVVTYGVTLAEAAEKSARQLAQDKALQEAVTINAETGLLTTTEQTTADGQLSETTHSTIQLKMNVKGEDFRLQARQVDQWSEGQRDGSVVLHTLYQVGVADHARFDRTVLTTRYGAAPVAMSVVPGLGQWYKGSRVKGTLLFGGVAACGVGALLFENQRKSNVDKMMQNSGNLNLIKHYGDKANTQQTLRNVCLGVGAAIWIYNLIDAATAQGVRRVVVQPTEGGSLTFAPTLTEKGQPALLVAWNF